MGDRIKFDIVMPHNNWEGVRRALETLRDKTPADRIGKVIFIDQNPVYQQVDDLVDIHIFTGGKNLGFSKAMNMGIRLSDADYIMCSNDDVEFLHPKWIEGIEETFSRYSTAVAVNPSSSRNPSASGAPPIEHPDFPYKKEWTEEEYDRLVNEVGKGHVIDGICTWGPIFHRERLEKVASTIPGKCYFDEAFKLGGQDYALNYNAYLTKIPENEFGGYRMLGTGLSFVYHYWYSTRREDTGESGVKWDNTFHEKFGLWNEGTLVEAPDIYGKKGIQQIVKNTIVE